jgi:bifunctional NMN adenylyltransferase/nudix hydrolase
MVAVMIARFQVLDLDEAQKETLRGIKGRYSKLVIVLAESSVTGSKKNPLDFHTRALMIRKFDPDIIVLPHEDQFSDLRWSESLDNLLGKLFPDEELVIYVTKKKFMHSYSGRHQVKGFPETNGYEIFPVVNSLEEKVKQSMDFRAGIIYGCVKARPKVWPAVDIAIFSNDKNQILLGRKTVDSKWRFPGGFVDPRDRSYEKAASRQLTHQCGHIFVSAITYEGSFQIDDWRYRNEEDKIITTLYSATFISGIISTGDDLIELRWFPLFSLRRMHVESQTAEEQSPLFELMLNKYADNKRLTFFG